MNFIVQIDDVIDDRPSGSVRDEDRSETIRFEGWVELLRVLERRTGSHTDQQGESR